MLSLRDALGLRTKLEPASNLGPLVTGENIGIEVELENMPLFGSDGGIKVDAPPGWTLHLDHSLRNNGVEFVFNGPVGGIDVLTRLDNLESFIKNGKYKPDASSRTSVHVHIDASNCNTGQMLKWLLIYTAYEPLLFSEFAPTRETSNFCIPICDSKESRDVISKLKGEEAGFANPKWTEFISRIKKDREQRRYSAVNFDAVRKFGTLEFRHLGGEYKAAPIIVWVNTLLAMKRWAFNTETTIYDFFSGPSKVNADALTFRVFGWDLGRRFLNNPSFQELYLKGVRYAQEIYLKEDIPKLPENLYKIAEERRLEKLKAKISMCKEQIDFLKGVNDIEQFFLSEAKAISGKSKKKRGLDYQVDFGAATAPVGFIQDAATLSQGFWDTSVPSQPTLNPLHNQVIQGNNTNFIVPRPRRRTQPAPVLTEQPSTVGFFDQFLDEINS